MNIDRHSILDLLRSLVDKSLVLVEERDHRTRYPLLETIRQYALDRLAETGEDRPATRSPRRRVRRPRRGAPRRYSASDAGSGPFDVLGADARNLHAAIDHTRTAEPPIRRCGCARRCELTGGVLTGRLVRAAWAHWAGAGGDRRPAILVALRKCALVLARLSCVLRGRLRYSHGKNATEALALAHELGDQRTAARARRDLGNAMAFTDPQAARAELGRAADLARAAGDDRTLVSGQAVNGPHLPVPGRTRAGHPRQRGGRRAGRAPGRPAPDRPAVGRGPPRSAQFDGRFAEAHEAIERLRAAVADTGEPVVRGICGCLSKASSMSWQGEPERALERLPARLERTLRLGAGIAVPCLLFAIACAELAAGRPEQARDRLEGLVALVEGRDAGMHDVGALPCLPRRGGCWRTTAAEATALEAQASAERIGTSPVATRATPHPRPPGSRARGVDGRPAARARPPRRLRRGRPRDLRAGVP